MSDDVVRIKCYDCNGAGIYVVGTENIQCYPCSGRGTIYQLFESLSADEIAAFAAQQVEEEE